MTVAIEGTALGRAPDWRASDGGRPTNDESGLLTVAQAAAIIGAKASTVSGDLRRAQVASSHCSSARLRDDLSPYIASSGKAGATGAGPHVEASPAYSMTPAPSPFP